MMIAYYESHDVRLPLSFIYLIWYVVSVIRFSLELLQDLLKHTPVNHADHAPLSEALAMTRNFLDEFNIIQTKSMFPVRCAA